MEKKLLLKFFLLFMIVSFLFVLSILLIDIGVQAEISGVQYLIGGMREKQVACCFGVFLVFPVIFASGGIIFSYAIAVGKILPQQIAELIKRGGIIKKIIFAVW
ncbi:MAG: hypothetical protein V1819_01995 [bacterium]